MDPETFTLANLFAMELSNYSDVISDIVGGAIKELGIETGVKDVAEVSSGSGTWCISGNVHIRYLLIGHTMNYWLSWPTTILLVQLI